jgi:hypothetical protein
MYEDDEEDGEWQAIAVAVPASALEYLQSIYRNPSEPDSRRMRAAMAALPFESPKLAAMAVSSMNGQDFGSLLDRAIARSQAPLKVIEHRPDETAPGVSWTGRPGAGDE